ncbi:hypothetical protein QBC45DRAFT_398479 [Copromyces sp. CBS 386.78]|nr:hypothetical protein QBC45DRAFT_398479 [Copromyces sp. CBS 386.78]
MKTIAILTMAFLPATFISTLLSMPSLNWGSAEAFRRILDNCHPTHHCDFHRLGNRLVINYEMLLEWLEDIYSSTWMMSIHICTSPEVA